MHFPPLRVAKNTCQIFYVRALKISKLLLRIVLSNAYHFWPPRSDEYNCELFQTLKHYFNEGGGGGTKR